MKIVILDGHAVNSGDLSWDGLRAFGELEVFDRTAEHEIASRARDADILLTTRTPISAQTLTLERLRYVGVVFTGYDRATSRRRVNVISLLLMFQLRQRFRRTTRLRAALRTVSPCRAA